MKILGATVVLLAALPAWSQPVPGSMNVRWNAGAEDCKRTPQEPIQIHAYESQTFILRQSPCANFEANFLYLLVGSSKALLIDTGAVAEADRMPLAKTVLKLLPGEDSAKLPLLVVHTHGHTDHRAGDPQFAAIRSATVAPFDLEGTRTFFGFDRWPEGIAHIDLGGRSVDVIPTPGHHPTHVVFYDDRTQILFSGDFMMPGRLTIDDREAFHKSALRVADFAQTHPITHVLGSHIEFDNTGTLYSFGSEYHPDERALQMTSDDLLALPAALEGFNGFYARHPHFVLTNPIHNLAAVATAGVVILTFLVLGLRRIVRRHRGRRRAAYNG